MIGKPPKKTQRNKTQLHLSKNYSKTLNFYNSYIIQYFIIKFGMCMQLYLLNVSIILLSRKIARSTDTYKIPYFGSPLVLDGSLRKTKWQFPFLLYIGFKLPGSIKRNIFRKHFHQTMFFIYIYTQ